MLGHRELIFDDYIDILKRRRWYLLLPLLIMPALAYLTMQMVPKRYVSTTLILIEQKRVPDDYVRPVVNEDISNRLASLKEQILSRSRLEPIIERFQLYPQRQSMSEKLDTMRKAIDVKPIRSDIPRALPTGIPGFTISFTSDQPRTAQQVCGEIASLFLRENLLAREQAVQGTTDFIKSQLDEAKRSLDQQDAKLAAFERAHFGEMPEQTQNNVGVLNALGTQLEAVNQSINQLQQNRMYLEAMISQAAQESSVAAVAPGSSSVATLEAELQKAQANLEDLKSRYTPDHPDVGAAEREVASLKQKIQAAEKNAATASAKPTTSKIAAHDSAQMAQMKAQLQSTNQAIEDKKREQANIRERLGVVQARVQSSPLVQEQMKELTRDYQTALQFYNDLLSKKNRSEMAGDLEKRQQGEQFRVMDPPNLPDRPSFPDPKLFLGGGVAFALLLSLGSAVWLEYRDHSIRNERDILAVTQLPTLGMIPINPEASKAAMTGKLLPRRRAYAGGGE